MSRLGARILWLAALLALVVPVTPPAAAEPVIVALGDSITAGFAFSSACRQEIVRIR